jgi:hypothetical protein
VESAGVVNLVDEAWKVGCDILEGFVCIRYTASTFSVFMKLSAFALS